MTIDDYEDYGLTMASMKFVDRYGPKSGFADAEKVKCKVFCDGGRQSKMQFTQCWHESFHLTQYLLQVKSLQ
jgi:hypothetical protein